MQFTSTEALLGIETGQLSSYGLARSIEAGLPVSALDRLAELMAPGDLRFKTALVPKATLERRRRSVSQKLTSGEGDRVARVAKVFRAALEIYKEPNKARMFLTRPHMMLDGMTPLDLAIASGMGADTVVGLLGRMAYGGCV